MFRFKEQNNPTITTAQAYGYSPIDTSLILYGIILLFKAQRHIFLAKGLLWLDERTSATIGSKIRKELKAWSVFIH
jgi:hypothetical protein